MKTRAPLYLLVLVSAACGGSIDNPRMCARLENKECPDGLEMFLRREKRLHLSGHRDASAGTRISVTIEDVSDLDKPAEFYRTQAVLGEDKKVVVPLEPGAFRTGAYKLHMGREGKEPDRTIEFSVWNTQAEIDARKGLKGFGARITEIWICKDAAEAACEESFHKLPYGIEVIRFTFHYKDAEPDTEFSISVFRNGAHFRTLKQNASDRSGSMMGYTRFSKHALEKGSYELVVTANKSKAGPVRKLFVIE